MTVEVDLTQEKLEALLEMLADNGAAPRGSIDPDFAERLSNVTDLGEAQAVAMAHRDGGGVPDNKRPGEFDREAFHRDRSPP